jgi:carboxyl-terminal processing protease
MTNVPVHTEQTAVPFSTNDPRSDGNPRAVEVVGIGTALRMDNRTHRLRITSVLPGTPAAQAGLSAGLIIQKVDDVLVTGLPLQECVSLIRGPIGSIVRLELIDPEQEETNTVELTRQKLQL